MTMPVYASGMHIDDDGTLVIEPDEPAAAGVSSIEFIEGEPPTTEEEYSCGYNTVSGAFHKPGCSGECGIMNPGEAVKRGRIERRKAKATERRITELESQVANWKSAHERAAVIAAKEATRQTAELRKQLADAQREIERSHEIIIGQNEEIVKAKAERDEANARAEAAEKERNEARHETTLKHALFMTAERVAHDTYVLLSEAEARVADLAKLVKSLQAKDDFEWCSDCQPEPNCGLWHGKCRGDCNHKCHDDYHKLILAVVDAQAALNPDAREEREAE